MTHKIYVAAKNPLVIPLEADADLVADDLIDLFRDNGSLILNKEQVKVRNKSGHLYFITIEKLK